MKKYSLNLAMKSLNFLLLSVCLGISLPLMAMAEPSVPENMVLINAGGFMRGIDKMPGMDRSGKQTSDQQIKHVFSKDAFQDEGPATMIYLSAYYIDRHEVSNAQYVEFIKATDYSAPAYWDHHRLNQPTQPVTGVNWYDANTYCHWANKRLPTEAEWEKAARGPAGSIYPWGNTLDVNKANFAKGQTGQNHITVPVDAYPEGKSYYGVYNMAGNVFEWVQDWYDPNYYNTSKETRNPKGPQLENPHKPERISKGELSSGKKKVIRGGSWFAPAHSITTTHRFWNDPMNNSYGVGLGFRCARDVGNDPQMQARSFYMDALVHMGAEKYKEAKIAIQKAIKENPDNREYHHLRNIIEGKL